MRYVLEEKDPSKDAKDAVVSTPHFALLLPGARFLRLEAETGLVLLVLVIRLVNALIGHTKGWTRLGVLSIIHPVCLFLAAQGLC